MQMKTVFKKEAVIGTLTILMMLILLGMHALPVHAAGIDMSTAYPGVTAKAGESVNFKLDFVSDGSYDADLSIVSLPEGFTGYFRGSDGAVNQVHMNGTEESLVTFCLTVPEEAAEGVYTVAIKADAGNGIEDTQELKLTVSEVEAGDSNFVVEYPEQEGASGTSFSFDTTIVNNRGVEQSYSLSAKAPNGWQVSFIPSGESSKVASLTVDAGASQGITVSIVPPESITEGEYSIPCTAISANETLTADLKVKITGLYEVELTTSDGRLSFDAYANSKKAITLNIKNNGNVDLENLNLTSSAPTGWEVRFEESTIELLEAGSTKEITAYVTPDGDAMTGDYLTTLKVSNDETSSQAEFRVSVKIRTTWGIAAVLVILGLFAGLFYVFKKYGRR